jgi:hypothetical protein
MRLVFRFLLSAAYLLGCSYFAIVMLGGGHGTLLFVIPLLTVATFVIAILITGSTSPAWARYLALGLVAFHYISTGVIFYLAESGDNFSHTLRVLEQSPNAFIIASLWYLCGHLFFWVLFFLRGTPQD